MNENDARHLMQLASLESVAKKMGFKTELSKIDEKHEFSTLYVQVEADHMERNRIFVINFFPASSQLENTDLLQFYLQFPFQKPENATKDFYDLMAHINRVLPLGHFNYSVEDNSLYFRHVNSLPAFENIDEEKMAETVLLLTYASLLFEESLEKVIQGRCNYNEAIIEIQNKQNRIS